MYEHQNLLSLWLVSFLIGLRTYQHPCKLRRDSSNFVVVYVAVVGVGLRHSSKCDRLLRNVGKRPATKRYVPEDQNLQIQWGFFPEGVIGRVARFSHADGPCYNPYLGNVL
jgi:hypothetical protein